jgi:hypothetical protein
VRVFKPGNLLMNRQNSIDVALGNRLIALRKRIAADFTAENWEELGLLTAGTRFIDGHDRLLRSLSWGDEDYAGNVLTVLRQIVQNNPATLPVIESYLDTHFAGDTHFVSAKPSERKITFAPNVFQVPDGYVELDLASVMMPFGKEFDPVHDAIKRACSASSLRCLRADDIWEESTIVQDIFNLVFRAQVVIVDFTGKNPNVMYETGIAHTLGKHVIPITQSIADVPFDMTHHRALKYLPNAEGMKALESSLTSKLKQFSVPAVVEPAPASSPSTDAPPGDDDIPF